METKKTKSGFISIVGMPNVGKSSLLNALIGQKVSIVSAKPQTTRTKIMGILTKNNTQFVFIDTPGVHKAKSQLGTYMQKAITEATSFVDAIMLVVDISAKTFDDTKKLLNELYLAKTPVILVINKIDLIKNKQELLKIITNYSALHDFASIVPISAKEKDGLAQLMLELTKFIKTGYFMFDEDALTDQPERILASEIIREKILRLIDKEIPHGVFVEVESMRQNRTNKDITDVFATIYCEKNNHKGILIGKNGSMLKKIGSSSRYDMEKFFQNKINLQLWVKVKEDWQNRINILRSLGFDNKI